MPIAFASADSARDCQIRMSAFIKECIKAKKCIVNNGSTTVTNDVIKPYFVANEALCKEYLVKMTGALKKTVPNFFGNISLVFDINWDQIKKDFGIYTGSKESAPAKLTNCIPSESTNIFYNSDGIQGELLKDKQGNSLYVDKEGKQITKFFRIAAEERAWGNFTVSSLKKFNVDFFASLRLAGDKGSTGKGLKEAIRLSEMYVKSIYGWKTPVCYAPSCGRMMETGYDDFVFCFRTDDDTTKGQVYTNNEYVSFQFDTICCGSYDCSNSGKIELMEGAIRDKFIKKCKPTEENPIMKMEEFKERLKTNFGLIINEDGSIGI